MCCKDHVAGAVGDAVVGICGTVIKKMTDVWVGGFCGGGLLGAYFAEGMKKFVVYCPGIVEEGTGNASDPFNAGFVKGWSGIRVGSVLYLGTT